MVALSSGTGEVMIGFGVNFDIPTGFPVGLNVRKELRMTSRLWPWKPLEG